MATAAVRWVDDDTHEHRPEPPDSHTAVVIRSVSFTASELATDGLPHVYVHYTVFGTEER